MAMHTELWFPSVVWSSVIHVVDNTVLKKWAYERKRKDRGRALSNFAGYQSNDILSGECEQIDKLVEHVSTEIKSCAKQVGLPLLEIQNIYRNIFQSNLNYTQAIEKIKKDFSNSKEIENIIKFISESERGIIKGFKQ